MEDSGLAEKDLIRSDRKSMNILGILADLCLSPLSGKSEVPKVPEVPREMHLCIEIIKFSICGFSSES